MSELVINTSTMSCCGYPRGECDCNRRAAVENALTPLPDSELLPLPSLDLNRREPWDYADVEPATNAGELDGLALPTLEPVINARRAELRRQGDR